MYFFQIHLKVISDMRNHGMFADGVLTFVDGFLLVGDRGNAISSKILHTPQLVKTTVIWGWTKTTWIRNARACPTLNKKVTKCMRNRNSRFCGIQDWFEVSLFGVSLGSV